MSAGTSIEWTDTTWNPVRGCTRVSEGCRHCYAERLAARDLPGLRSPSTGEPFARRTVYGPRWTGRVELIPSKLDAPLRWRTPRRVFVNSMSDLFHESLAFRDIAQVFERMAWGLRLACRKAECACECEHDAFQFDPSECRCFADVPQHTYQVLTKRPARMLEFFEWLETDEGDDAAPTVHFMRVEADWPLPNVWLGVSVEDQVTADARIPLLLRAPAAVRWVSYEPALGPVDFGPWIDARVRALGAQCLDWIVVGGESGPGARPFDLAWARSTVEQARAAGVPVFVKQVGARPGERSDPCEGYATTPRRWHPVTLRDHKGATPAEWPAELRVRELPGGAR